MKRYLLASAMLAAMAAPTSAADIGFDVAGKPYYLSLQGVYGPVLGTNRFLAPNSNAPGRLFGTVDYNNAWTVGGTAGVFLNDNWRLGAELNYFDMDTKTMRFSAASALGALNVSLNGRASGFTAMVDVGYETKFNDRFGGFVEAGAGLINLNLNTNTGAGFNGFVNDSDTVLAGKVGAGLTYELRDGVELYSKYNLIFGQDANLRFTAPGSALNPVPFTVDTTQHAVLFGVRFKLQ